jgi:hypothetical protein
MSIAIEICRTSATSRSVTAMRRLSLLLCLVAAGACNIDLAHDDAGTTASGTGGAAGAGGAGGAGGGAGGPVMGCSLLQASCPSGQACFPYPFESPNPTTTACSYPGTGDVAIPCQTQLECDGSSICSNPGDPSSVCLARCDLTLPYCGFGSDCVSLKSFRGVGACTL